MNLENTNQGIWEFVDGLASRLSATGHWIRVCQNSVDSKSKTASEEYFSNINSTVTDVDLLAQESILEYCSKYENLIPLGEEQTQLNQFREPGDEDFILTVDPLDGTYAYTQGHQGYCTMICLFNHEKLWATIIHFPAKCTMWVVVAGDGIYRADCGRDITTPYQSPLFEKFDPVTPAAECKVLAAHYRLLKAPFDRLYSDAKDGGYEFSTLRGDSESEGHARTLVDSNGELAEQIVTGAAAGFIAPFISVHDVFPILCVANELKATVEIGIGNQLNVSYETLYRMVVEGEKRIQVSIRLDPSMS